MKPFLRVVVAIIVGLVVGGAVNMALIVLSPHVVPPPAGVDVRNTESMRASIHLFEPKHFVFPFLAHALGTLSGAAAGAMVAGRFRAVVGYVVGVLYLGGGIAAATMIPAPGWFIALDLALAYLPMAWLGVRIAQKLQPEAGGA